MGKQAYERNLGKLYNNKLQKIKNLAQAKWQIKQKHICNTNIKFFNNYCNIKFIFFF